MTAEEEDVRFKLWRALCVCECERVRTRANFLRLSSGWICNRVLMSVERRAIIEFLRSIVNLIGTRGYSRVSRHRVQLRAIDVSNQSDRSLSTIGRPLFNSILPSPLSCLTVEPIR